MSFFCLFLFVEPNREYGFVRCCLSSGQLSLPLIFSLIGAGTPSFRRLMFEFDFRADTFIRMRRAHRPYQPSSKKHGLVLRSSPQTTTCDPGVNQILFCHAISVTSGGYRYAG